MKPSVTVLFCLIVAFEMGLGWILVSKGLYPGPEGSAILVGVSLALGCALTYWFMRQAKRDRS